MTFDTLQGLRMRSLTKLALVVPAFLLLMNSASAVFTFQIVPASANVAPGGSTVLNILAFESTSSAPFGPQFTLSSGSLTTGGSPSIGFVLNLAGGTYTANSSGNPIGTITASALPGTPSGTSGTVRFTGVVNASSNPALIPLGPTDSNTATVTAVPEPSSFALLGAAGLGFAVYRSRRRAKTC